MNLGFHEIRFNKIFIIFMSYVSSYLNKRETKLYTFSLVCLALS